MNTDQAKKIELSWLLSKLGCKPVKSERGGRELKFTSPFRPAEEEPSFNLNLDKNAFYDFGQSTGGNTLDFAIEYLRSRGQASSVSDALTFLDNIAGGIDQEIRKNEPNLFTKSNPEEGDEKSLEFARAMPLKSKRVLEYLQNERCIPEQIAAKYLSIVQYNNLKKPRADGRPYYAFGMKNISGGWEIRSASDNPAFKSALIKRDISIIPGSGSRGQVLVFEGMLDYCSLLVLTGTKQFTTTSIIMHSLSSFERTMNYIKENDIKTVKLFLDRDPSGIKCAEKFKSELAGSVEDMSGLYHPHEDVNKALQSLNRQESPWPELKL